MELCARCKKNPAVLFITKMENGQTTNEGLCLGCAKELGIAPLNNMIEQLGVSDENLDDLNNRMSEFIEDMGGMANLNDGLDSLIEQISGGDEDEGGAATAPLDKFKELFGGSQGGGMGGFMSNIFGGGNDGANSKADGNAPSGKKKEKRRQKNGQKSMLETYGTNLTAKAALGQVDRVINRDAEIERVIQILNRRQKNNPVILGEPGVGKTAVAEGLACKIFAKEVPPKLFGAQLYLIDFAALVAGTQFRGQFEVRLKSLLSEAEEEGNAILVIDEIHNIVAAGDAEGAMSAANILKPALARGQIQIIGATTLGEYRKHIEKDSALERRFQPVILDEPTIEESIEILEGIKGYYEDYHHVKISREVVEKAVRMSERYITDRFLPDKAIDVIDEAGSRVNLKNKALYDAQQLKEKLDAIKADMDTAAEKQDYESTAKLKTEEIRIQEQYNAAKAEADKSEIHYDDIAAVIEAWTKIPVHNLTESETEKLLKLEDRIHERVIGQEEAVKAVARAIRRGRADITSRKRPVSFIFAGPTGVGKTELVKTIAEVMFGSEEALVRFDMSEYMEKHSVSKLIGSPPGYVGYDDAGQLTEKIRRRPYSVILLDEVEKAHPDVFNLFLQILDDGRVADSHGKMVNFENTIIVMTTNAGSESHVSLTGFMTSEDKRNENNTSESLKRFFRPEFLNRVDEIITFKALKQKELRQILELLLKDIEKSITQRGAKLTIDETAMDLILEKGTDEKFGARPLKRAIQKLLEDKLAMLSLQGGIKANSVITAKAENDEIVLSTVSMSWDNTEV